jgi:outer membrane protein assembly factor BamB
MKKRMESLKQILSSGSISGKPIRLLPGVIIVIVQWLIRFGIPLVVPGDEAIMIGVFAGILGGLAVAVWWAFFSRAPLSERWSAIVLMLLAFFASAQILHESIVTANMGLMFTIYSIPVMSLTFVVWAVSSRHLSIKFRRVTMVATILLTFGFWALLRTNGMTSDLHNDFSWRWAKTQEERFMANTGKEPMSLPSATGYGAEWPGFRGPNRDGIIHGKPIKTDWKNSPPKELWRRPIGPGCSSFAIGSGHLYTQEQRGDQEVVSCYDLLSGKPVWMHNDKARFEDSHAGAGPRATPTLSNGLVYTFGATGILNALNAMDGSVVWSRNAVSDTGAKESGWGFAGSPLVVGNLLVVAASGKLAAYKLATGQPQWYGPDSCKGYSSPHLLTIDGVAQILLMSDAGATSLSPSDGTLLWKYSWPLQDRILQPAMTAEGDILLNGGIEMGMRLITVKHEAEGWKIKDRWTSAGLKPYFNDFVVHKGHAYGFNGRSLACIDLNDGTRKWQDGRYGGQILLLADQDLLLVLSEKGELALVEAVPDKFRELARIRAIEGKTWNHPVLAGDVLVVRNSTEMVAFRLAPAGN